MPHSSPVCRGGGGWSESRGVQPWREPPRVAERRAAQDGSTQRVQLLWRLATVDQFGPTRRARDRPGVEQARCTAGAQLRQRAARSCRGGGDQAGAQRIALDIVTDGNQMRVVLDQELLVAPLMDVAPPREPRRRCRDWVWRWVRSRTKLPSSPSARGHRTRCHWLGTRQAAACRHGRARRRAARRNGGSQSRRRTAGASVGAIENVINEAANIGAARAKHGVKCSGRLREA